MVAISSCRSCQGTKLQSVLDLGKSPLANALRTKEQLKDAEEFFPLHLVWCDTCALLQITENVSAEKLFSNYFYRSSFSDSFLDHCKQLALNTIRDYSLSDESLVVDIASNDGYLLQYYQEQGIPVLGIEPAKNIADIAQKKGVTTLNDFFTYHLALQLAEQGKSADIIHAHNVLPHVANQRDFIAGICALLKPKGRAIIEFAYAIDTIDHTEFDQIYHEHMCYFSLTSFQYLCASFNLAVEDVKRLSVHGGSLRVVLAHLGDAKFSEEVHALLEHEELWGVRTVSPYQQFTKRTLQLKSDLCELLQSLQLQGKRIVVYGASAKGSTLMNFFGIGRNLVEYIVDRSTMKHGFYAPGTNLRIEPTEKLLEDQPDYVLLLTWNFVDEILKQQQIFRDRGGKFIIPIPTLRIV